MIIFESILTTFQALFLKTAGVIVKFDWSLNPTHHKWFGDTGSAPSPTEWRDSFHFTENLAF